MKKRAEFEEVIEANEGLVEFIITTALEKVMPLAMAKIVPEVIVVHEKHKAVVKKEEARKRIHNTKQLLKRYIELSLYADKIDDKVKASISARMPDDEKKRLIEMLEFNNDIVKTIKESTQQTIVMLQHIKTGMDTIEVLYKKEKDARTFNIVKDLRITGMKPKAVADKYDMDPRSIYKVENRVAERLAVLLFGIYGIKIE